MALDVFNKVHFFSFSIKAKVRVGGGRGRGEEGLISIDVELLLGGFLGRFFGPTETVGVGVFRAAEKTENGSLGGGKRNAGNSMPILFI